MSVRLTGPYAEDDLDDVDLLIAKYHNTSCGSFDRLTNASCLNSGPCSVRGYTGPFSVARLFTAVGTADGQL